CPLMTPVNPLTPPTVTVPVKLPWYSVKSATKLVNPSLLIGTVTEKCVASSLILMSGLRSVKSFPVPITCTAFTQATADRTPERHRSPGGGRGRCPALGPVLLVVPASRPPSVSLDEHCPTSSTICAGIGASHTKTSLLPIEAAVRSRVPSALKDTLRG